MDREAHFNSERRARRRNVAERSGRLRDLYGFAGRSDVCDLVGEPGGRFRALRCAILDEPSLLSSSTDGALFSPSRQDEMPIRGESGSGGGK